MKFHALLPVRDEGDIIAQSLRYLLSWSDAVYVFDSGSLDETWEIVQEFAAKDKRLIPLRRESVFFSDKKLRAWIFDRARANMKDGDWFLRVDADEFHDIPPPEFVKTHLNRQETVVFHQYYDFRLRASDVIDWEKGRVGMSDRERPIEERRRSYVVSDYTEPRLCRYRSSMRWPETTSFPYYAGYRAVERLPIRHYPHRDPEQMQRRCEVRNQMMQEAENLPAHHWAVRNWREHIVADSWPALRFWEPGTELPRFHFTNHLTSQPKRALQRLAHAFFVRLLDRFRPQYSAAAYPRRIAEAVKADRACVPSTATGRHSERGRLPVQPER